jgi:hypothetical protein
MSEAQHEKEAQRHERISQGYLEAYDPQAAKERRECSGGGRAGGPCWTSVVNPTQEYLDEAKKHRKIADEHRAAAQALRDAEAAACAGISDSDRNMSPFERSEDIEKVEPLIVATPVHRSTYLTGATITFKPVPGLTADWLQREVNCHIARNVALSNVVPEMPDCPLVPKGVEATVKEVAGGALVVEVRSENREVAEEVLNRAKRAMLGRSSPAATQGNDRPPGR